MPRGLVLCLFTLKPNYKTNIMIGVPGNGCMKMCFVGLEAAGTRDGAYERSDNATTSSCQ